MTLASDPIPSRDVAQKAGDDRFDSLASDLSADGRWLALGAGCSSDDYDRGGPLHVWDVARRARVRSRMIDRGGIGLRGGGLLRFSPSGRLLLACVHTNELSTFDATQAALPELGNACLTWDGSAPGAFLLPGETTILTHGDGDRGLAIVPIAGQHDGDSTDIRWLEHVDMPFLLIAARADGLIIGADNDQIVALDLAAGKLRYASHELPGDADSALAFSVDGTLLAGAGLGSVAFVDTASGKRVAAHRGANARAASIIWDARSRRTAMVRDTLPHSDDPGDVAIFEALAPRYVLPVQPRNQPWLLAPDLCSFAFAPDGARCAVATAEGDVVIYELAAAARELARMRLAADPDEWLGVHWAADDAIVVVTSSEVVFLDPAGTIFSRAPLGFPIVRDFGPL
jgi:hypothetical protein